MSRQLKSTLSLSTFTPTFPCQVVSTSSNSTYLQINTAGTPSKESATTNLPSHKLTSGPCKQTSKPQLLHSSVYSFPTSHFTQIDTFNAFDTTSPPMMAEVESPQPVPGPVSDENAAPSADEIKTVFHDVNNFNVKHPLLNSWSLWVSYLSTA